MVMSEIEILKTLDIGVQALGFNASKKRKIKVN